MFECVEHVLSTLSYGYATRLCKMRPGRGDFSEKSILLADNKAHTIENSQIFMK